MNTVRSQLQHHADNTTPSCQNCKNWCQSWYVSSMGECKVDKSSTSWTEICTTGNYEERK